MLFSREPQQAARTWFLIGLSVLLMVVDYRYHQLNRVRDYLSLAIYPVQWIVNVPRQIVEITERYTQSNHQLIKENERLSQDNLLQRAGMLKFTAIEAENARLQEEITKIKVSKSYARKVLREKYHTTDENEHIVFFAD